MDIEVDLDKPDEAGRLLVGYSADVEIILAGHDKVLRIPTAAIQEGGKVLLFNADSGKLEDRPIKAGLANWEYTEILDGLKAGDRIVTSLDKAEYLDGYNDGFPMTAPVMSFEPNKLGLFDLGGNAGEWCDDW